MKRAPMSWVTKFSELVCALKFIDLKPNWRPSYSNWSTHICSPIFDHRFNHRRLNRRSTISFAREIRELFFPSSFNLRRVVCLHRVVLPSQAFGSRASSYSWFRCYLIPQSSCCREIRPGSWLNSSRLFAQNASSLTFISGSSKKLVGTGCRSHPCVDFNWSQSLLNITFQHVKTQKLLLTRIGQP